MVYRLKILMFTLISFFILSISSFHNLHASDNDEPPVKKQRVDIEGTAVPRTNQPPAPNPALPPAHTQVPHGGHGHAQIQQGQIVIPAQPAELVTPHTQEQVEERAQPVALPSATDNTSSLTATTTNATTASTSTILMPQQAEVPHQQVSLFPEGWSLKFLSTFNINGNGPFNFKPIHQSLKTLMDGFTQAHQQGYVKKEGEEGEKSSQRNIVVGNLQIIFQLPNDQYHTLNVNLEHELEPGKNIIFQSGFKKLDDIADYKVINGNEKIIPLSTFVESISSLYEYPSSIINQNLYTEFNSEATNASEIVQAADFLKGSQRSSHLSELFKDDGFCQLYGHSEQFLIHTMFGQKAVRHNIHKVISQNTQSVQNGKIIALVLHLHSYFDLCKRCSVTLSKHAEDLAYKNDKTHTGLFHLISTEHPDHITTLLNSHKISIVPDVKLLIVASSQHALKERRIVMNDMRNSSSYQQPFDITSEGIFMFQIDPQNKEDKD